MEALNTFDLQYKERRYRELQLSLQPFRDALFHVRSIMPAGYIFDLQTKELSQKIDPEWQRLIDKINEEMKQYVADNFPEFKLE